MSDSLSGPAPTSPLSYPAFRVLWLASIVSYLGGFVQAVGEAWLMMDLTKSPVPVAMITTVFVTSMLVMMLPGGVLADRYDRRKVAMVSQIVQASTVLVMAVLSYTHHITPAALLVGVAVVGSGAALGAPAWSALLPSLVPMEQIAEAVALSSIAFNIARAVGPAIGGAVLARFGATTSFLINAASFIGVMIALMMYRSGAPPKPRESAAPIMSSLSKPWRLLVGSGGLRPVLLSMLAFTLGAGMIYALLPAFGRDVLGASPLSYGVLVGALGVGAVLGGALLRPLRRKISPRVLVTGTMLTFALPALAFSRVSSVPAGVVLMVFAGIGWLGSFSSLVGLLQVWAPDRVRARVLALYQMAHLATWAVASSGGGFLADHSSVRIAMSVGGVICTIAALATWRTGLPPSFTESTEGALEEARSTPR